MPYGYNGKILRVNLTDRSISIETPDENFYRTYMGGEGIIAYYLLKEVPAGTEPFSPDNRLVFAPGILTGMPLAGSGRNSVGAKSPLTGGFGSADGGGFFGAELKRAGWDGIVVSGKADNPVYLWINDDIVEIRDAAHLWGKTTAPAQAAIKAELGDQGIRTALIGPGGEKMVRYACVLNDLTHAAGRTGTGAVMGSKHLKAVAVRGHQPVQLADPSKIKELAKWLAENVERLAGGMREYGTAAGLMALQHSGGLPTRNFREGTFEGAAKISGQTMRDTILVKRDNCFACPINCKRVVQVEEPYQVDPVYGGPEYETLGSFGSSCGIDDLKAIAKANELCNANSLDTISTGVTIAFAMECFERGILTEKETDGLELRFGNAAAMLELVEKIANREGFGNILAEGTKRAAAKIGRGAEKYAIQVKGQEVPMHEPRLKHGLGLGYAVSPTGADHCHNMHDTAFAKSVEAMKPFGILDPLPADDLSLDKARLFTYKSNMAHFNNVAVLCNFVPWRLSQLVEIVRAVTGWDTSLWELAKAGERAATLARVFNLREGFSTEDDNLTERFLEPFADGPLAGVAVDREKVAAAREAYYSLMGWDTAGMPTKAKLHELGVGWATAD
ncbi:MAG: aldehyde ferredoxin oxidoreductase family protein [bacterium]|jgi:aldehyde:ferredoxin oxidoreductase